MLLWLWSFFVYGWILADFMKGNLGRLPVILTISYLLIILLGFIVDELIQFIKGQRFISIHF